MVLVTIVGGSSSSNGSTRTANSSLAAARLGRTGDRAWLGAAPPSPGMTSVGVPSEALRRATESINVRPRGFWSPNRADLALHPRKIADEHLRTPPTFLAADQPLPRSINGNDPRRPASRRTAGHEGLLRPCGGKAFGRGDEAVQLARRQRLGEEVSLPEATPQPAQHLQLDGLLHALGHGVETEGLAQAHYGAS